jgi:hypothetical protein
MTRAARRVEVAEGEVRIIGSKSRLLQTLVANGSANAVSTQVLRSGGGRGTGIEPSPGIPDNWGQEGCGSLT